MHQNGTGRGQGYKNYARSGPLMTDHLQVRDLDRELELLRRKREVVQREQQMLTIECEMDRKRQYEHANCNVSDAYGNVWLPPPSKRTNTPHRSMGNPWTDSTHDTFGLNMSKPMPANYIPSLLSKPIDPPIISVPTKPIVHPMLKNRVDPRLIRPFNARKDFRPTNITKKKLNSPPNKLNTYPLKDRKNLVLKATESQLAQNKANKLPEDAEMVLRENQTPNNQVNGRLELALGNIVKEIRTSYSNNDVFQTLTSNPKHQRTLKQAVRERIRSVMLNKTVGPVVDIVKKYREKFTKATDKDLVELVINSAEQPPVVTLIETDNPEEFFKKNITSLLQKKIKEMASKLLKMYSNDRRKAAVAKTKDTSDVNKKREENESILNNEMAMKVIRSLTGKYVTVEEKNALTWYYTELIQIILEEKLPEYLPQCKDEFLKIFDLDNQFKAIKLMATDQVRNKVEPNKTEDKCVKNQDETSPETDEKNNTSDTNEAEEKAATDNIPSKEIIREADIAKEVTQIIKISTDVEESSSVPETEKTKSLGQPENITQISPLAKDTGSSNTINPTTPMANKPRTQTPESSLPTLKSSATMSTPLAKELPYYVKLIGRPKLPVRAVICDFLNNYRPNSIKKHKSINNLLVVGFANQEDYNKILTANETVIGDITIVIKASEKVAAGKENESTNERNATKDTQDINNTEKDTKIEDKAEQEGKDKNEICKDTITEQEQDAKGKNVICKDTSDSSIEDDKDLIGKDLDDQISDLLTTIKETDENEDNSDKISLESQTDGGDGAKNEAALESEKVTKVSKANVKESGRATPVRSSSRLGNVTPSTIRTRRASRLMQE